MLPLIEDGDEVEAAAAEGAKLLESAAGDGHLEAITELGRRALAEGQTTAAIDLLDHAAAHGDPAAHVTLGEAYLVGGPEPDMKVALRHLHAAARKAAPNTAASMRAHRWLGELSWERHLELAGNATTEAQVLSKAACKVAAEHYKYVAEGGPWGKELQQAYWAYSDGQYARALLGYAWTAELGFDTARGGLAHLLGGSKSAGSNDNAKQNLDAVLATGCAAAEAVTSCRALRLELWQSLAGHGAVAGRRAREGDLLLAGSHEGTATGRSVPTRAFVELGAALLQTDKPSNSNLQAFVRSRKNARTVLGSAVERGSVEAMLLLAADYTEAAGSSDGLSRNLTLAADLYALGLETGGAPVILTTIRYLDVRWRLLAGDTLANLLLILTTVGAVVALWKVAMAGGAKRRTTTKQRSPRGLGQNAKKKNR
eukprot:SAG31_NODE_5306_length_2620_cov_3.424038_3_plen_427_part_00